MTNAPTPPNAGEPVAYRMILRDGTRVLGWMSTEGLSEKDMVSVREVMEGLGGHVEYAYTHPQPNAGVVTDALHAAIKLLARGHPLGTSVGVDMVLRQIEAALSAAPKPECTIVHSEDPTTPDYMAVGTVNPRPMEKCG